MRRWPKAKATPTPSTDTTPSAAAALLTWAPAGYYVGIAHLGAPAFAEVVRWPCFSMWVSNSKRIVGMVSEDEIRVWRVVGGLMSGGGGADCVRAAEEQRFKTVEAVSLQFSPMCDDVIVVFSTCGWVKFIDLEASCRQRGHSMILWRPDGSTCTLHYGDGPAIFLLRETATGVAEAVPRVLKCGCSWFTSLLCYHTEFQVYSTENLCTASLCVPCTWASPSILPTGLIASTSHDEVKYCDDDGTTGFHVGDFSIPLSDPNAFNPACD
ncbi:hypothetical protein Pelo_9413 [Pelomyxa schiedti]|nr:hypothetical protein Pelo_9413 [Pelomyxa schiedti]